MHNTLQTRIIMWDSNFNVVHAEIIIIISIGPGVNNNIVHTKKQYYNNEKFHIHVRNCI